MAKISMYELRDEIAKLSASERANLTALLAHKEATAPYIPSRADTEVWNALARLCPMGMRHRNLNELLLDKSHGMARREWSAAVETIGRFCAQAKPVRHPDEDRAALTDIVLECLVADMRSGRSDDGITPKTILEALPRLAAAVDRAFPGYIEAGLLDRLIRRATAPAVPA